MDFIVCVIEAVCDRSIETDLEWQQRSDSKKKNTHQHRVFE